MKKILGAIKRASGRLRRSKITPFIIIFLAGVFVGAGSFKLLMADSVSKSSKSDDKSRITSTMTSEERSQAIAKRIDSGYKQSKESIVRDVKDGKLTQAQADALNKKLEEVYNYRKKVDNSSVEQKEELRKKRKEWRDWASENDVSSRYFLRMY